MATGSPRGSNRIARTLWVPTSIASAWSAEPPAPTGVMVPERDASIGRPWDRRPVGIRAGETTRFEQRGDARSRGLDLLERQELAERDRQRHPHAALDQDAAKAR